MAKMCKLRLVCKYSKEDLSKEGRALCPKNTNSKCEIVKPTTPSKRKSNKPNRWVTIKGWAGTNDEYGWKFIEQGHGVLKIPAELRIKAKYIKDDNNAYSKDVEDNLSSWQ